MSAARASVLDLSALRSSWDVRRVLLARLRQVPGRQVGTHTLLGAGAGLLGPPALTPTFHSAGAPGLQNTNLSPGEYLPAGDSLCSGSAAGQAHRWGLCFRCCTHAASRRAPRARRVGLLPAWVIAVGHLPCLQKFCLVELSHLPLAASASPHGVTDSSPGGLVFRDALCSRRALGHLHLV